MKLFVILYTNMGQVIDVYKFQSITTKAIDTQELRAVSDNGQIMVTHLDDEKTFKIYQIQSNTITNKQVTFSFNVAIQRNLNYNEEYNTYTNNLQLRLQGSVLSMYSLDQYHKRQIGKMMYSLPISSNTPSYTYYDVLFSYDIMLHPNYDELVVLNENSFYLMNSNVTQSYTALGDTIQESKLYLAQVDGTINYYAFHITQRSGCSYLSTIKMLQTDLTTHSIDIQKEISLPCVTNIEFNRFNFDTHNQIFGINLVSTSQHQFYTLMLNSQLETINQNWILFDGYHFHIFSETPNTILGTKYDANYDMTGKICYIGYEFNNSDIYGYEYVQCTSEAHTFSRLGQFSVNETKLIYALDDIDLDLYDQKMNKLQEIQDFQTLNKQYSYVPKFYEEFTTKYQNKILSFSQNYDFSNLQYQPKELSLYNIEKTNVEDSTALIASLASVGGFFFILIIYCLCINRRSIGCCNCCECCQDNKVYNDEPQSKQDDQFRNTSQQRIRMHEVRNTFCPLCQSQEKCYWYLPCNHYYHENCIRPYLDEHKQCFICKKKAKQKKLIKIRW